MSAIGRRVLALTLVLTISGCISPDVAEDRLDTSECVAFKDYSGIAGTTVSVYSPIRAPEDKLFEESWQQFSDCTGVKIRYEGSGDFEAQLKVRVDGGASPDVVFLPQPGLLDHFVRAGKLKILGDATSAMAKRNYTDDWLRYAQRDGNLYGVPLGSSVKSFVWYSPRMFAEKGWKVPKTWDEMIALSEAAVASGIKPWCAGIESGVATGWPITDWIEDVLLREHGADVYDQWVTHKIPFNDPRVVSAVDRVGSILKNEKYVNGGYGGVKSIATTSFQEGGIPIAQGKCAMHRQASFYANQWQGAKVAEDGDVFAFYLPPIDPAKGQPVLAAGEFVAAFADRPEVRAFQTYLASADHANTRAKLGNWISPSKGLDLSNVANPIVRKAVQLLQDPASTVRFDGSDLMPASVGAGSFWKAMTDWIISAKDTRQALDHIESTWPRG